MQRVNIFVCTNLIVWPVISGASFIYINVTFTYDNKLINALFWTGNYAIVLINLASCVVLAVAFKRISRQAEEIPNLLVNRRMMAAHLVSYALFVVSIGIFVLTT